MARFNAIKCDGCAIIEELPQSLEPTEPWVTLKRHGSHEGQREILLCSLNCAVKWTRDRAKVEKDLRAMTSEEFCEKYCIVDEGSEIHTHSEHCARMKAFPR